MARKSRKISVGQDSEAHLGMGVLALCFPMSEVKKIIRECGKEEKRVRDLPASVAAFYVVALSLFPGIGYQDVLGWLISGLRWLGSGMFRISGKGALSAARQRLGETPLRLMHERMVAPASDIGLTGSFWKGLHLVAIDGSTLALQDTPANAAAFGRPSNQYGTAAYPLARFAAVAEVGTHIIFAAEIGTYNDSEIKLAERLIPRLKPGMLCLADRLFPGYELWKAACGSGASLLWRAKASLALEKIQTLPDGSWLAKWYPSRGRSRKSAWHTVRVVEYKLVGVGHSDEIYRLITNVTDAEFASAEELAMLYPQRWEVELSIKENKQILRHGQVTLRSKTPELVRQEFWGMLLAHYLIRKMIVQAAVRCKEDPDGISHKACVEIVKSVQAGPVLSFPP